MKIKKIIMVILISSIVVVFFALDKMYSTEYYNANKAYLVYLNGKKLGMIEDNQSLYNLINNEQQELKNKYNVDSVYPPSGFELMEVNTFSNDFTTVNNVYNAIAELDDFTVKGYKITIKFAEEDQKEDIVLNVLDKKIFEEAIRKFITAFISEDELNKYINGEKETLTDIGSIINTMYFNETITIKEDYISANDTIYTDVESLSQYLLFGPDAKMDSYTVKLGDSIDSISEAYDLNPQEFIIANPVYRDTTTMLKVGTNVNVTLLNPVLTFIYEVYQIEETSIPYSSSTVVDKTKPYNYSEVTQAGVTGIRLDHENFQVKNGEPSSEIKIVYSETIREAVNQITTIGPKQIIAPITGTYVDYGGSWGWPTNQPSKVTSPFAMRWGKLHSGIDISGTGYGSPVYSIADGVVVNAQYACSSCAQWANGTYVVVQHANNYYSAYLHLSKISVSVGTTVKKGDVIAAMGQSGKAFGTHLHLGLFIGEPYASGANAKPINPMTTIYKQR